MDSIMALIAWLIGLYILYHVIRNAIDNSDTARNIKEIKNILLMQSADEYKIQSGQQQVSDIPIDRCPACGAKLSQSDKICPSCGLTIVDET